MQEHDQQHTHEHNHIDHHRMMIKDFRNRFYFSLVLTIPILALTPLIQDLFGFSWTFPFAPYIVFVLATILYIIGGWPFLSGLVKELSSKDPGMMTLIGMAITVAYAYSTAVTFGLPGTPFYWELATLIAIMLAGHWIEMASVVGASSALEKLAKLMPSEAHKQQKDGSIVDISLEDITTDDVLIIKPGEKIPADGHIEQGESHIDESMLTGESRPVRRGKGDKLIGGSINGDGSITLRVDGIGEDAYLSKIISMVRQAQQVKSKTQRLSDRAARYLTLAAITVGIVTLVAWLLVGRDLQFAITRMATVMIITCPHALGLAIPLVVSVSTAKSAQNGLLIRNRTAFEQARHIQTIVFDKTGTLTEGTFSVTAVEAYDDTFNSADVLKFAASLEEHSEHPIGKSIVAHAEEQSITRMTVEKAENMKGKGIGGTVDGKEVLIASPSHTKALGLEIPPTEDEEAVTRVFVIADKQLIGSITLSDTIRAESKAAIDRLHTMGISCWMLTGDNEATARSVSNTLGMDGYFAEVLPDEKQQKIKELQKDGTFVAMTGDGVNDSPALAQADIGIAIGSGTDVAASTADIILVNSNPEDIVTLILFGKATYRKMIQNLIWATAYNLLAIPLAAGVLFSVGVVLTPEVGAILMTLSTIIVAINARLLKIPKLKYEER